MNTTTTAYTIEKISFDGREYEQVVVTVPVTIGSQTRETTFRFFKSESISRVGTSVERAAFRIGRGTKLHGSELNAYIVDSVEQAKARGYRADEIHDLGDFIFVVSHTAGIRNTTARAIAWADEYRDTQVATQQRYYGSL